jgi:hypothetical protein
VRACLGTSTNTWIHACGYVHACSWPAYLGAPYTEDHVPYHQLARHCNLWRNYNDINDSWVSVQVGAGLMA